MLTAGTPVLVVVGRQRSPYPSGTALLTRENFNENGCILNLFSTWELFRTCSKALGTPCFFSVCRPLSVDFPCCIIMLGSSCDGFTVAQPEPKTSTWLRRWANASFTPPTSRRDLPSYIIIYYYVLSRWAIASVTPPSYRRIASIQSPLS